MTTYTHFSTDAELYLFDTLISYDDSIKPSVASEHS
jgi:hypothetical protein